MKKQYLFLGVILIVIISMSCARPIDIEECVTSEDKLYGFWNGLWHGLISVITFIISLFNDNVDVYAVNNNGGWYDFGFMLGVSGLTGGGSSVR